MYSFTRSIAVAACVLSFCDASPHDLHERAIDCSDPKVKSLVSTVKALASAAIDPFCSSYLHYTQSVTTTTVVTTSTLLSTSTVKKGTTTITTTVTETGKKSKRAGYREKRDPRPAPAATITADSAGSVYGFAADVVSGACSCLVTKPSKPSTVTKTSTKVTTSTVVTTVQETKTVTVTTKVQQSTTKGQSSTTKAASTTTTKSQASTSKGASSTTTKSQSTTKTSTATTSTSSSTLTQCDSANPTFYIQLKDPGTRTDQYNNQYLATAPDTYRGIGAGYVMATTPSKSSAVLVYLELSTTRLRTVAEGWYANADYFVALAPTYFDTAEFIEPNEWQYFTCSITAGILNCFVPYPGGRGIAQTCPEYVQYYYTPFALGDKEYQPNPNCYRKNMVVIPACTPKT